MLVVLAQTGFSPVTLHVGIGLTVTVSQQLLVQPFRLMASQTTNVQLPVPATTVIEEPEVEPRIVPQPVIDQLWVEPAVALEV